MFFIYAIILLKLEHRGLKSNTEENRVTSATRSTKGNKGNKGNKGKKG